MNNDPVQFSEREKDVTELLLQGKSNKQIALALGVSANTVEYHLKNLYRKLQVNSRTEAVLRLGKSVGSSVPSELGKSVVEMKAEPAENGVRPISTWRISMNKMFALIGVGVLAIALIVTLVLVFEPFVFKPTQNPEIAPTVQASVTTVNIIPPASAQIVSSTSTPAITPSSEYLQYEVTAEDSCDVIAVNFNIPVEAILEKNNLSPSCILTEGQILLLPFNSSPVHLYEASNNPSAEFLGEWANADPRTADKTRVSIQMNDEVTYINMFGNCQPTECDFRAFSPAPAVDYNYDAQSGILHVMWIFDFAAMTQELTITSDGQLKVVTQNHYLDDSGRLDFTIIEYFARQ